MKKALNKKFSSSSKLVRKVLSRSDITKTDSTKTVQTNGQSGISPSMSEASSSLQTEIDTLKTQITTLKLSINSLQTETEAKDIKLSQLAREKEKLSLDLLKTKRSNTNLYQQLDDERKFYYKEKQIYCEEMNQVKKIKQVLSGTNLNRQIDNAKEIQKLRKALEQALHTNYNLSVKFLKIKDAKSDLKITLEKTNLQHKQIIEDLRLKIEQLSREMNQIINQKFHLPISASNKKYLHIVNQNSLLVYENLCLQLQIDQLQTKLKRIELKNDNKSVKRKKKNRKRSDLNSVTTNESKKELITIFERDLKSRSVGKISIPEQNESKLTVFQVSATQSEISTKKRKRSRSAPKIIQSVCLRDMINIK